MLLLTVFTSACGSDPTVLEANGTVEIRTVDLSPLVSGRLVSVFVDEGDDVLVGDTMAVLTAPTLESDLVAAQARVSLASARLGDLDAGSRPQELQRAAADLTAARIEAARLEREHQRARSLHEAGALSRRDFEAAEGAAAVAAERVESLQEGYSLLQDGARTGQLEAARAELATAQAVLRAQYSANDEYVLTAPIDGVVLTRIAEPGDLLTVGRPVLELGQVRDPWVRVYLPAWALPLISIGDSATIHPPIMGGREAGDGSESSGDWSGQIVAINPRAEFVTRTALTEEERADLLFGVKVIIHDNSGAPKAGLPVRVTFPGVEITH